ncbi:unnamed protein product [Ilex paraguariensis]|uniref:MPN domain-containing protein n=1 Tax=Ilex paraguariensis TaxID=185542 RepID=A0ABC8RUG2_9AQUA
MRPPANSINVNAAMTRKINVDNRIPLRNYYRIADNLLKQASIYREEKNIIDLYIILLRYSSLVSETIPFHRDYQALYPKERLYYKKKLLSVIDELESLQPEFRHQLGELEKVHAGNQQYLDDGLDRTPYGSELSCLQWPAVNNKASLGASLGFDSKQLQSASRESLFSWNQNSNCTQVIPSNSIDMQFQKLSLSLPLPKKETLSRHSLLGPNGLRGQWMGPSTELKVHYPTTTELTANEKSSMNEAAQNDILAVRGANSELDRSVMDSVLSLDDGRWSWDARKDHFQLGNIRQPSPPPVLAQVQQEYASIPPSKVADPRPGPAKPLQDGTPRSNSYQHLHLPVKMMEDFLRLAQQNTAKNLETCGVLAGSLKNRVFHISMLIIPKQESTSDSCQTLNEEEIFEVQDKFSLFQLGWIHTHPSQTCFMSSVDLHTHYSYQIMLPEAIAIVMAPKDTASQHGIFHLSDPSGVSVIRNCQERGFHPHEEPEDGNPIYEHSSHVYMNENLKFDVVDLR